MGGFAELNRLNYRSLLQKSPLKETIFCVSGYVCVVLCRFV